MPWTSRRPSTMSAMVNRSIGLSISRATVDAIVRTSMSTPEPFFDQSYSCRPKPDPEQLKLLEYHLQTGDYFPLLSTVMGFFEEAMRECQTGPLVLAPMEAEVIQQMREGLI